MADETADDIREKRIKNLLPHAFTPENAADNARKSAASRVKNIEKAKNVRTGYTKEILTAQEQLKKLGLSKLADTIPREDLPQMAIAIMADNALRVLGGEWDIKSAEEATKIAKIWHDILRLEMNQATTISGTQNDTPETRQSRLDELRLEAKRRVEGGLRAVAGDL
ncbi:hypothetical protein UFOVP1083_46 [uncultured Caudovirales phage]|uniref:Uncharacterized protein n=1 Tax=uncultured Caudovirales phage TaxID=2100421 RepID=A0A6J5QLD0_9CAUD|nr:hypothetical protein UFOVP1083_46 [uncultured Caudovirales phage]CAB4198993.1 hypothetical protein UFOVP1327_7 [uncultured Caudovirales phage]